MLCRARDRRRAVIGERSPRRPRAGVAGPPPAPRPAVEARVVQQWQPAPAPPILLPPVPPPPPRRPLGEVLAEWSAARQADILLYLGAFLLSIAALIFVGYQGKALVGP